jgi:hypothetical protein
MEVIEVIFYQINHNDDTITVEFRLNEDTSLETRLDTIDLKEADDFGFKLITEDSEFFDNDDENDYDLDDINEDELLSFLNEYYMIYSDRLPKKD